MAKLDNYKVDIDNTENQGGGDFELMPEMNAVLEASAIDLRDTRDERGTEAVIVLDIVEPEEFKGRKLWAYWIISHQDGAENKRYFKFGKPMFDRLCRAVDVPEPEDTDDLLFKQFVAKIGISKGGDKKDERGAVVGKYDDKNEIKTFFYPDQSDKYPEIGVIEGGAKPAAANDNKPASRPTASRPAAAQAPAREPGSKPWAKAKAAA
jgi:hypothetical protein